MVAHQVGEENNMVIWFGIVSDRLGHDIIFLEVNKGQNCCRVRPRFVFILVHF